MIQGMKLTEECSHRRSFRAYDMRPPMDAMALRLMQSQPQAREGSVLFWESTIAGRRGP